MKFFPNVIYKIAPTLLRYVLPTITLTDFLTWGKISLNRISLSLKKYAHRFLCGDLSYFA